MSESLPLGAHLITPRLGYFHHGVYVGDGRVIQYSGFNRFLRRGPVEEVSVERFTRGRGFRVKPWVAPRFSAAACIERARSRLGENRYRFWSNNCEHFCHWCISGTSRSAQVEAWTAWRDRVLELFGWSLGSGRKADGSQLKCAAFSLDVR